MKQKTNQIKKLLTAIVIALLIFACAIPLGFTRAAKADESEIDRNNVYYFTDYKNYSSLISGIKTTYSSLQNVQFHTYARNYSNEEITNSEEFFIDLYNQGAFDDLRKVRVIFEMREEFQKRKVIPGDYLFTDFLNMLFSDLKSNGCKIMFISGTDEDRFNDSQFLSQCDIHLNLDLFQTFFENFAKIVDVDFDEGVYENCTFILDKNLASADGLANRYTYFMQRYLLVSILLQKNNREDINTNYGWFGSLSFLKDRNIKILCHVGDDLNQNGDSIYLDIVNNRTINLAADYGSYDYELFSNDESFYAIGFVNSNTMYTEKWLQSVNGFKEAHGYNDEYNNNLKIFLYNENNYDLEEYVDGVYVTNGLGDNFIAEIIASFIEEEYIDNNFVNWEGECAITIKCAPSDFNNWMCNLFVEGFYMCEMLGGVYEDLTNNLYALVNNCW